MTQTQFATIGHLNAFIQSDAVKDSFEEYLHDFLRNNRNAGMRDFGEVTAIIADQYTQLRAANPNKQSWTPNYHAARFILRTGDLSLQAERLDLLDDEWDCATLYSALYEVLLYLVRSTMPPTME